MTTEQAGDKAASYLELTVQPRGDNDGGDPINRGRKKSRLE